MDSRSGHQKTHARANALIHETSPYLLQHAHNPVHWYPWGEKAMEKAKKENKLLLISIGYSSCHWCHVMERESFEDEEVATLMNEHFVNIKVDREERPDIDHIYMTAVQMLNQQGGWPLNCVALPDGRPVWGGTYFPRKQWMEALGQLHAYYRDHPEQTERYAEDLADGIRKNSLVRVEAEQGPVLKQDIRQIVKQWSAHFDPEYGGPPGAPKFPMPVNLEFLLHYGVLHQDQQILDYVDLTLTKMARGGIYDQVGGGFARYSVDRIWKVPHFEKMLYDNAQLTALYASASMAFDKELYREIVRQTIAYIQREMVSREGAFYSAQDADSDGEEGKFYVWDRDELKDLLKEDFGLFADYYNIHETEIWENGKYILYRTSDPEEFAAGHGMDVKHFLQKRDRWREILLSGRSKRNAPLLDDKSLTSWNALMISALTRAYRALGEKEYLHLALKNAILIREKLLSGEGILFRKYKNGESSIPGYHIDYALYIQACLDLYEVSMDQDWLGLAGSLTETSRNLFLDQNTGLFNLSPSTGELLLSNSMEVQDNVIPSSNSVMAHNLFRLGHLHADRQLLEESGSMAGKLSGRFEQYPRAHANWGQLLLKQTHPYFEVVVAGPSASTILKSAMREYLPHVMLAGTNRKSSLPLLRDRYETNKTRIFVCQKNICHQPLEELQDAREIYHI
ncbi:MAG: thioredoxin domain-containing protein [Bacteroidales bacterium]